MKEDPVDFIRRLFAPVRGPGVRGVAGERMLLSVIRPDLGDLNSGVFRVNI